MHHLILSLLGLVGMSACLYYLGDLFRILVLGCVVHTHKITQRVLTAHWIEAHARLITKSASIDITLEQLSESTIEVVGPFLD